MATEPTRPPRTRAQIEAEQAAIRERMAGNIEALIDQVHPQRIKERQIESAKAFAMAEVEHAKSQVFHPNGDLRTTRLVAIGGAVAGFVAFVVVMRRIVRGGKGRNAE